MERRTSTKIGYKYTNPFYVITYLVKVYVQHIFTKIIGCICSLIYIVTFEKRTKDTLTLRKAKRIRTLTKLKLYAYKHCSKAMKYLGEEEYLKGLHKRFEE